MRRRRLTWLWLTLAAVGLSSWWWLPPLLRFLESYWSLPWAERDQRASVFGMVIGAFSAVLSVVSILQSRRPRTDIATPAEAPSAVIGTTRRELEALPRMSALTARRAGVHEALPAGHAVPRLRWWMPWRATEAVLDTDLPLFVPRELSAQVTDWMRQARREGGFLLLVGTSSVGKTRLLFDTAHHELGDFRVLVPDLGDGGAANALADAALPGPMVMWLDELQRFLAGPYFVSDDTAGNVPLTAAALRRLLDSDVPVVVLATLWPDYLDQLRATNTVGGVTRPRHPAAADVLALRPTQLRVSTFTDAEKQRARELRARDPRLALATVDGTQFNVTEALAGAPRIMQRYHEAPAARQAVIHAAVDARRLGIQGPLSRELLRKAARGYLTEIHTDDTWFDRALTELTRHDRREDAATAPLLTVPTADHRDILGYTVTDYLLQELRRQRRSALLTDTTWNALVHHNHNPDDRRRLADNAQNRCQYRHAERLYRALADAGDTDAAERLAWLLIMRGLVDQAVVLMRTRADAGDTSAAIRLAVMLGQHGKREELRALAHHGDTYAADRLAWLLIQDDKVDEAEAVLRPLADAGNAAVAARLAVLKAEQGGVDQAVALLRPLADAGDTDIALSLARLLAERGDLGELRTLANAGNTDAAAWLALHLDDWRKEDNLLAQLNPLFTEDIDSAADRLIYLLVGQDKPEELRPDDASRRLIHLLARQDRLEELRTLADTGNTDAAAWLAMVLAAMGSLEELRTRGDDGDTYAAFQLVQLLARQSKLEELRTLADAGTDYADFSLAQLLTKQGELQLLWDEVHAGNTSAASSLDGLLRDAGREEDADQLRMWGVTSNGLPSPPW